MSARATRFLALLGGFAVIAAALTVPSWLASPGVGVVQAAQILHDNRVLHYLYVSGVLLSGVCMAPVVVLLAVRLYRRQPGPALLGAGAFLFGLVLEAMGGLVSLARLGVGVSFPEATSDAKIRRTSAATAPWGRSRLAASRHVSNALFGRPESANMSPRSRQGKGSSGCSRAIFTISRMASAGMFARR